MKLKFLKFVSISAKNFVKKGDAIDLLILLNVELIIVLNAISLNIEKIIAKINEQRDFLYVFDLMCQCSLLFESNFLLH